MTEKGAEYYERIIDSIKANNLEELAGGELAINAGVLEVSSKYDVNTGEKLPEKTFVVTTGGPHAEFRTSDEGKTYTFHYWDWFGSDAYNCKVEGSRFGHVERCFGIYFGN